MNEKALQEELQAAYKELDNADRQIKNLLLERKQQNMVVNLLDSGGFITEGKLEEAIAFSSSFNQ